MALYNARGGKKKGRPSRRPIVLWLNSEGGGKMHTLKCPLNYRFVKKDDFYEIRPRRGQIP